MEIESRAWNMLGKCFASWAMAPGPVTSHVFSLTQLPFYDKAHEEEPWPLLSSQLTAPMGQSCDWDI
jgi:hypothetical protein